MNVNSKYPNINLAILKEIQRSLNSDSWSDSSISLNEQDIKKANLAVAYANLILEDINSVTEKHVSLLEQSFSSEEIHDLTNFIFDFKEEIERAIA